MLRFTPFTSPLLCVVLSCQAADAGLFDALFPDPQDPEQYVLLFDVGGWRACVASIKPELCQDELQRRTSTGFRLYQDGYLSEARECFEGLLATEKRVEATLMCGVIAVREADYARADMFLQQAIRLEQESPHWSDPRLPLVALVWMHWEQGQLEAAVERAVEVTGLPSAKNERAWHLLAELRRQRGRQLWWQAVWPWLAFGPPIAASVAYLAWRCGRAMGRSRRVRRSRQRAWDDFLQQWPTQQG